MQILQELAHRLLSMQWSDYLDIALVAYVIYKLLPLVRTPHVMRIARTVVVLVLVTWLTDVMDLYTLNWMLSQVLAIGLLAFVVLFQPELRRMLEHLSNVKISKLFDVTKPVQEMEHVISQTVMACEVMSQEKVGALIVFSREQRLEEYFKTGTQIDGQVSAQLLRNIFFKNSPLHDGATIIRDGRIAAAGCVLPLSDNHRLSADLGTRHRAGVGMSEASDAVVVIVSEENGSISVAANGMLKRHLAPQTLEKLLRNELCPEQTGESGRLKADRMLKKITKSDRKEQNPYEEK